MLLPPNLNEKLLQRFRLRVQTLSINYILAFATGAASRGFPEVSLRALGVPKRLPYDIVYLYLFVCSSNFLSVLAPISGRQWQPLQQILTFPFKTGEHIECSPTVRFNILFLTPCDYMPALAICLGKRKIISSEKAKHLKTLSRKRRRQLLF